MGTVGTVAAQTEGARRSVRPSASATMGVTDTSRGGLEEAEPRAMVVREAGLEGERVACRAAGARVAVVRVVARAVEKVAEVRAVVRAGAAKAEGSGAEAMGRQRS